MVNAIFFNTIELINFEIFAICKRNFSCSTLLTAKSNLICAIKIKNKIIWKKKYSAVIKIQIFIINTSST